MVVFFFSFLSKMVVFLFCCRVYVTFLSPRDRPQTCMRSSLGWARCHQPINHQGVTFSSSGARSSVHEECAGPFQDHFALASTELVRQGIQLEVVRINVNERNRILHTRWRCFLGWVGTVPIHQALRGPTAPQSTSNWDRRQGECDPSGPRSTPPECPLFSLACNGHLRRF